MSLTITCTHCDEPITARPDQDPAYQNRTWATDAEDAYEAFGCPNRSGRHEPESEIVVNRRRDGLAFLTADGNLSVPCSRYGRNSRECAEVAWRVAYLLMDANGEPITLRSLDGAMSLVCNDHDDVAYLVRTYGHGMYR